MIPLLMFSVIRGRPLAGGVLALALAACLLRLRRTLAVVTVTGESMQPTYSHGDRVLVRRVRLDKLRNGHIVVIERPASDGRWHTAPPSGLGGSREWIIKRVVALPGDRWQTPSRTVPAGSFAVQGDNPSGSYDSRIFGYCPAERLLGVVIRSLDPARPRLRRQQAKGLSPELTLSRCSRSAGSYRRARGTAPD